MPTVYIGIGSNLGPRERNCLRAVKHLARAGVRPLSVSTLHETAPQGVTDQPRFVNMALVAETALAPPELLAALKRIERSMGRREEGPRWGPRVIDLDILLYDSLVLNEPDLVIPHPLMHQRSFVLMPLAEVAPDALHPVLNKTVAQLLEELPGPKSP